MDICRKTSAKWNRVLVDICTQRDFLDPGAILQVSNRESLINNLQQIFAWAQSTGTGIVSSVESHRPTELLKGFPLHCIDGTPGQEKLPFTLVAPWMLVESDNCLSVPPDLCRNYRQLIFRKRGRDVLGNPKTDRFMTYLTAGEIILCGVGLERSIRSLALSLLAWHRNVTVVFDACGYWIAADADLSIRQLAAKGIKLVSTADLIARPICPPKRTRGHVHSPRNRHHPTPSKSSSRISVQH